MDHTFKKEKCSVCEKLLESSCEQPVDLELSLPDYCSDIERILKCRICPGVTSKSITGDRLDVDGSVTVRLYYLDSKKQAVRLCAHTIPFSCSFELKNPGSGCAARVKLRSGYLNCRALSPRKLDIHGAFSVIASVYRQGEKEYCSDLEGGDIRQLTHNERISTLAGVSSQQFSLSEVLDIGKGKGTPESILRSELTISADESRAIENKLMLKGEAVLKVLYITDIETGAQDMMSFNIPVSQIIDVPGITESTINDISVDVMSYDISLRSEYDESSTLITLDAKLSAVVFAYEEKELTVIDDAYSTEYELDTTLRGESFDRVADICQMDKSISCVLTAEGRDITRVCDIWCENISSIADTDPSKPSVRGKLELCMLALDGEGVPFCAEKAVDFSFDLPAGDHCGKLTIEPEIKAGNISFRITDDNSVEAKAGLKLCAVIHESCVKRCLVGARANEDKPREKDRTAAVTLYYADGGEKLWDIARQYCTSVEAVKLENGLTEDIIEARSMILIPMQ